LIARVLPLTPTRAVRGAFDYRLTDAHQNVGIGSLMRVPFGRRVELGVVAELANSSELPHERLAEPASVLETSLPADLVELALWMAREYCSTPARALMQMLPPGAGREAGRRGVLTVAITDEGSRALGGADRLTSGQLATLTRLRRWGELPATELGTPGVRRLERRGLVSIRSQPRVRRPAHRGLGNPSVAAPGLTDEQRAAVAPVLAALVPQGNAKRQFLLHGVTGSGKTEVYLAAVHAALAAGRGAIMLVPEIALTPQTLERFRARFGDVVAVIHSGLRPAERHEEWRRLRTGEARIAVGARSAVFAPLHDVGVVIVDEEHESSYKHEGDPRYDARAVAQQRARMHAAVLVAGSATPRPESVHSYRRLRLSSRVDGGELPAVEILDMRGSHHPLHAIARLALADLRRTNGKAIVLLNRRGWSNFLSCQACGHVWMCPNCEVAMVLHRTELAVACHHCGHTEQIPDRCPACGSVSIARHGAGTERLQAELQRALAAPEFPVLRLDADAAGVDLRARTLERFMAAPAGLLVGTQMIAKGHDFRDVALGLVLDADQTLRFPDFRAEERTFALVTQLAGRVGRGGADGGRVLVQTHAPGARAIALAAHHDAETFLLGELERRRALSYPPFATLIRIVCSDGEPERALSAATALREALRPPQATVLGPARLFALRAKARWQIVVKASERDSAIASVDEAVSDVSGERRHRGVNISVDVDPQ
jgi:primosomal protein N' (replication factor Y)